MSASEATAPEVKQCGACAKELPKTSFSKKQWEHKKQRRCKDCIETDKPMTLVQEEIPKLEQAIAKSRKKKSKPVRAAAPTARYNTADYGSEIVAKLPSHICSWCGKVEETVPLSQCTGCKNIYYCGAECQKAAWPEHKLVCQQLKNERKEVKAAKKEQKIQQRQDGAIHVGSNTISEASGTGSFAYMSNPGAFSMAIYKGELRGLEQPGHFFSTEEARESVHKLLGAHGFQQLVARMEQQTRAAYGTYDVAEYFTKISELSAIDQFLFSCGPEPNIKRAKNMLEVVLQEIQISGLKPAGSQPDIGDITVRGYGLNALEWAARRGNYDIAEWLATDPRTKVMLTRKDSAPVAWACYTNRVELAKMLIKHGADSHATYDAVFGGKPPTHLAAENGQLLAVKYLVEECGHDIFERDSRGQNIRTCIRTNFRDWKNMPGSVAVDEYAKSKGVREYS